ncbi:MAG: hypothetical protein LUD69_08990, partial [Oscillospiraceae bacterium]|nr:hypothetical protein [Oscillospiraceae bacterium]
QRVVPAMMLFEGVRDQLEKDGLLRPIARNTDHIWQQMTSEHFMEYLNSEKLFMRAHREYDDYDEKKLLSYIDTCYVLPSDNSDRKSLEERLNQLEKRMYISCWYSSEDLSDMVFREYSKNGIALGTDVGQLIHCLNKFLSSDEGKEFAKDRFYVGNVQYVYHQQLVKDHIFENTQVVCPMFLKGIQFKVDSEFRVCIFRKEGAGENPSILVGKIPPRCLIRRVAFRADREHLEEAERLEKMKKNAAAGGGGGSMNPEKADDGTVDSGTPEPVRETIKRTEMEIATENLESLSVDIKADQAMKITITERARAGCAGKTAKIVETVDISLMKTLESNLKKVGLEFAPGIDGKDYREENGFIIYELRERNA